MTHFSKTCALLVVLAPATRAQTAPAAPKADVNPLNSPVEAPAPAASSSQALHDLAKGAGASLLADADDLDKAAQADGPAPTATTGTRRLRGRLNDWSATHNLNWKRTGGGTLLVWSAPDPLDLIARWKAEAPATPKNDQTPVKPNAVEGKAAPVAAPAPVVAPGAMSLELSRFFATPTARRVADNPASWRDVPVSQLPAPLREAVLALCPVSPQLSSDGNDQAQGAILDDEFWKTATLRVQNMDLPTLGADGKAEHHLTPMLFLQGHFVSPTGAHGTIMLGLSLWPKP